MLSLRLLIIEDSEDDATLLVRELRRGGFDPDFARVETPQELESALEGNAWDAVISDYSLPAFSGLDALRIIRAKGLDLPFILVSGVIGEETAVEAMKVGAHDFILKGNYSRLAPALTRELGDAAVRRERRQADEALRRAHAELEQRVAERTAEIESANTLLRDSRRAALNMMEDAVVARRQAEEASAELRREVTERKRAEEALRNSYQRLDILAETASQLLMSDSPQEVVDALCQKVMAFLDCHIFFNFLVDEEAGRLHLNACAGIPEEDARRSEWLDYGVGLCGCAARDASRIVAEDIPNTPDPRTELVKSYGIRAYACHPLVAQGRVLGTLSFGTRSKPSFSDDELALMNAVADQVAIAMERKRTGEELRRAHGQLEKRVLERTEELAKTIDVLHEEIAEREQAEEALRESEKKYRTIFEETRDVIFILDADGKLLDVNPAGPELFGYPKEELLSLDVTDLYCDAVERAGFRQMLHDQGDVRDYDLRMKKKGGECLDLLVTAAVIRNERGEIIGDRGILHDVTERRRLEQQLLQSQKMESIGMLAGGVAHDFNNLLTAISGYGQLIKEQYADRDENLAMCTEQIMEATGRAVELVRNLLAFSRKQIINPYPVQVNDIVVNMSKLLTRIIGEDIEFSTQMVSRALTVLADRGQIEQVLVNLATNARDAMPQGGRLLIRTEQVALDDKTAHRHDLDKGGAYALISVADSGQGMDRETAARIFEPFFTTKETGKGTGLGLAIIYGIVKQHGGTITVASEPGRGTTFTVYLPLIEAAVVQTCVQDAHPAVRGTETLLLAEDDAIVRKYMQKILEMAGHTVIIARNGAEAVEQFRENRDRIALVLCDVVMPKKNGREVYDEIRSVAPGARFLFVSGYNDEIIHRKGILPEEIEFLEKPVSRQKLLAKLREILDRE